MKLLAGVLGLAASLVLSACAGVAEHTAPTATKPAASAWTAQTTVGEVVAARPQAARIFDLVGIDYCCGGAVTLGKAAAEQKTDLAMLLLALEAVGVARTAADRDWRQAELGELMDHIVAAHHAWLRRELPKLAAVTRTVLEVHGREHPELAEVSATLDKVRGSVLPHLDDEEKRVFPALRALAKGKKPAGIDALLEEMHSDHDELGAELHRLRSLTANYKVPEGACAKYREMLSGLAALERDMHTHVHLENNVLLVRARALLVKH